MEVIEEFGSYLVMFMEVMDVIDVTEFIVVVVMDITCQGTIENLYGLEVLEPVGIYLPIGITMSYLTFIERR